MPIFRKLNHFLKLAVVAAIIPLGGGASAQESAFSLSSPDLTTVNLKRPLLPTASVALAATSPLNWCGAMCQQAPSLWR